MTIPFIGFRESEFPLDDVVQVVSAIVELKGSRFGCLQGRAADRFARHVCEILDVRNASSLTLEQIVDAYESSPFYEDIFSF
jgi:hypothetical protein